MKSMKITLEWGLLASKTIWSGETVKIREEILNNLKNRMKTFMIKFKQLPAKAHTKSTSTWKK